MNQGELFYISNITAAWSTRDSQPKEQGQLAGRYYLLVLDQL